MSDYRWVELTGKLAREGGLRTCIDAEDYDRVTRWTWYGRMTKSGPYIFRTDGKISLHRFLLGLGPDDPDVDHKNGVTWDNRKENLRLATVPENAANARLRSDSTSGFKGVSRVHSGRYRAAATYRGHQVWLGTFDTPEEASEMYDAVQWSMHREYAKVDLDRLARLGAERIVSEVRSLALFSRFIHEGTPAPTTDRLRPDADLQGMVRPAGCRSPYDPPSSPKREDR